MEIKLNPDELTEKEKEIKRVMSPQYLDMMDRSGKKVRFEIVAMVSFDNHAYIIVQNPNDKTNAPRLAVFEQVYFNGQTRFNLVTDRETIIKVNDAYADRIKAMDDTGLIPHI